jgi:hypothetical protein
MCLPTQKKTSKGRPVVVLPFSNQNFSPILDVILSNKDYNSFHAYWPSTDLYIYIYMKNSIATKQISLSVSCCRLPCNLRNSVCVIVGAPEIPITAYLFPSITKYQQGYNFFFFFFFFIINIIIVFNLFYSDSRGCPFPRRNRNDKCTCQFEGSSKVCTTEVVSLSLQQTPPPWSHIFCLNFCCNHLSNLNKRLIFFSFFL